MARVTVDKAIGGKGEEKKWKSKISDYEPIESAW